MSLKVDLANNKVIDLRHFAINAGATHGLFANISAASEILGFKRFCINEKVRLCANAITSGAGKNDNLSSHFTLCGVIETHNVLQYHY